jgi:hypothetical protein
MNALKHASVGKARPGTGKAKAQLPVSQETRNARGAPPGAHPSLRALPAWRSAAPRSRPPGVRRPSPFERARAGQAPGLGLPRPRTRGVLTERSAHHADRPARARSRREAAAQVAQPPAPGALWAGPVPQCGRRTARWRQADLRRCSLDNRRGPHSRPDRGRAPARAPEVLQCGSPSGHAPLGRARARARTSASCLSPFLPSAPKELCASELWQERG